MQTERRPAIIPNVYRLLSSWCYLEYSLLRMWAGWGRYAGDWEDKLAVCRHTWLQAEIVERMRCRMAMFPGGKAAQKVVEAYEHLANAVLLAPNWPQAMAGIHALRQALNNAYIQYRDHAHVVHDRPTFDLIHETLAYGKQQTDWYQGFCQRYPHQIDSKYQQAINQHLSELGQLLMPIEPAAPFAEACGKRTKFRLPKTPGRVKDYDKSPNIMPYLAVDW